MNDNNIKADIQAVILDTKNKVLQTSGTTGHPKKFTLTSEQIALRANDIARIRPPGWDALTSLYSDFGPNTASVQRDTLWASQKNVKLFRPLATFEETIKQFVDNNIQAIFASPSALVKFSSALAGYNYCPKIIISSGSLLTPDTSKLIRAGLGNNLWTIYSTSEIGTLTGGYWEQVESTYGCVGTPYPGVEIQIVNGEIQAKTPIMFSGYSDPKLTASKVVNGWFLTGDRGEMAADGTLIWKGRI
jgi:long-subunit acyl-CoA synthetase (AMP-forming)